RCDAHQLVAVPEDGLARTCMPVGERDYEASRQLEGIGQRLALALQVVDDPLARDLFQQQLRHMPASVIENVDDESVAVTFGDEIAMEFGEPRRHHVGQMKIPDAAL